jgi:hypothetical protein
MQRSGGSQLEARQGKYLMKSYLRKKKKHYHKKLGWWNGSR